MRPRVEQELFRLRLDKIIDMNHALVKLARAIDWRFPEERFGAVYTDKPSLACISSRRTDAGPARLQQGSASGSTADDPRAADRRRRAAGLLGDVAWQHRRRQHLHSCDRS